MTVHEQCKRRDVPFSLDLTCTLCSHPGPNPSCPAAYEDSDEETIPLDDMEDCSLRGRLRDATLLLDFLPHAMRYALATITSSCFVVLAVAHSLHAWYTWSQPTSCRLEGMEPYRHTTHCRVVHIVSKAFVRSNVPLLDGPPPLPLYRVDFQELHGLQCRMTEHMLNASTIDGAVMLKFIANELNDKASDLYQLRTKVSERDHEKGWELQRTLSFGVELGGDLAILYSKVRSSLQTLFVENRIASIGIEETFEEQPKSHLAQILVPLFPRYRDSSFWTWDTDTEVRFRFYKSFTMFSWMLYSNLVDLVDHQRSLEVFGKKLEALQLLLVEEASDATPPPASDSANVNRAAWFFPWRTTAQSEKLYPQKATQTKATRH